MSAGRGHRLSRRDIPLVGSYPLPLPRQARTRPQHLALEVDGQAVPYGVLAAEADDLARGLASLGLGAGDRVAACLPNGRTLVNLLHAVARLGAILVPLNSRLTVQEIGWQVADADPRVAVWDPDLADRLPGMAPGVRLVTARRDLAAPGRLADAPAPADLGRAVARLQDEVAFDAPLTIVYTSGTAGRPKGTLLTHGNHLWSALGSAQRLGVLPDDRWLLPLPLFHVGGLAVALRSALYGTTMIVHQRFEPPAVADALATDVTLASLVPTMLARVLATWGDRGRPQRLRAVLLGGGPVGIELLRHAAAVGIPVAPTYGLTEAASQVATAPPAVVWPGTTVTAEPLAFTVLRVVDEAGQDRPVGEVGEILVRGPTVMKAYWRQPAATARALVGGWLHTGDAGWLDSAGRLSVVDRRDDLIVSGGENVYPAEVEAVLDSHPDVAASCVVGLPDPEWGQVVVAVVVARRAAVSTADLIAHARAHLAGYKIPRRILWAATLPRTATGKLRRSEVRAGLVGDDGRVPASQR